MNSRTLLVASSVTFALILLQFGLLVLRNHVRSHLFPPAQAAERRAPGLRALQPAAVMRVSTSQACNPASEE